MLNKMRDPEVSALSKRKIKMQLDKLDQVALREFIAKKAEKDWLNKQFNTHQEFIKQASDLISNLWDKHGRKNEKISRYRI